MKTQDYKIQFFNTLIIPIVISFILSACSQIIPDPPVTKKEMVTDTLHAVVLEDPYRWLEDQESPETRAWIDEQNEYTESLLGSLPFKQYLTDRYTELLKIDVVSTPHEYSGRFFFTKRLADQDLSIIYIRKGLQGEDQVLIDPHGMSEDHSISVSIEGASPDGSILVYGIRKGGEDEVAVRFLNVDKNIELADSMPRGRYWGVSITPDNNGYFYTKYTSEGARVYYHKMGINSSTDMLIFGEGYDPGKIIFASLSEDGKHLLYHVLYGSAGDRTDIFYQDASLEGKIIPVVTDINATFLGEISEDEIFIITNWEAPNYRAMKTSINDLPKGPSQWTEIIPESKAVVQVESSGTIKDKLFVHTLENVVSKAKIYDHNGNFINDIELPSLGAINSVSAGDNSTNLFYSFSSFHIPTTIYRYDIETGTQEIWSKLEIPVETENIEVNQVWYKSKDSTEIPMFLIHRKGLKLDGKRPVYLTGYGGFNVSRTPGFSATTAIWVENGGVYALPNLRGGGEFGEEWHKAGMLEKKQNVFDDFIAAAEWLIDNNYTNPDKLSIRGGSNGGLLVGACMTQRPDLYKAVTCTYPLLDMIRYHQFMVARFWVPEYGSSENPEQFKYILDYSPYHNVKAGTEYPATLFITGDADTRVAPLHARKMTALVQELNGSDNPILLYYDTKAGHTSGGSITKSIEDNVVATSFLFWQLGIKGK